LWILLRRIIPDRSQIMPTYDPTMLESASAPARTGTVIKVVGLGGGGSNAINRMIELGLSGVEFIACNTDHQALTSSLAATQVPLGPRTTRGLGAGGNPEIGEAAAQESSRELAEAMQGADMVFLTAGMGGGTGTGAIAIAAEIARSQGAIVVAIVTVPFTFEGRRRMQTAQQGLEKLRDACNTLITIPNDRLLEVAPKQTTFDVALRLADDVLRQGVQAIAELITRPGLVNVDFSHVRALMQLAGGACLAVGHGSGPDKAIQAVRSALHNPMLEIGSLESAAGLLVHFTGGEDLELAELQRAMQEAAAGAVNAEVFFGAAIDPAMKGRVQVIIVATGVGGQPLGSVLAGASHIILSHPQGEPMPVAAARNDWPITQHRSAAAQYAIPAAPIGYPSATADLGPRQTPPPQRVGIPRPFHDEPLPPAVQPSYPRRITIPAIDPETAPAFAPAPPSADEDLEVPAFLRRRVRTNAPLAAAEPPNDHSTRPSYR
jgi:cell division protein FtsZ